MLISSSFLLPQNSDECKQGDSKNLEEKDFLQTGLITELNCYRIKILRKTWCKKIYSWSVFCLLMLFELLWAVSTGNITHPWATAHLDRTILLLNMHFLIRVTAHVKTIMIPMHSCHGLQPTVLAVFLFYFPTTRAGIKCICWWSLFLLAFHLILWKILWSYLVHFKAFLKSSFFPRYIVLKQPCIFKHQSCKWVLCFPGYKTPSASTV